MSCTVVRHPSDTHLTPVSPVGGLCVLYYALRRCKENLAVHMDLREAEMDDETQLDFNCFAYFVGGFEGCFYYWEIIVTIRKFMVSTARVAPQHSTAQGTTVLHDG